MTVTMTEILRAEPRAEVRDDRTLRQYVASAPPGWCWDGDLHALVAPYAPLFGVVPRGREGRIWRAEARADLLQRVRNSTLTPCEDPGCDLCHRFSLDPDEQVGLACDETHENEIGRWSDG